MKYSLLDQSLIYLDQGIKHLYAKPVSSLNARKNPANDCPEAALTRQQKKHVATLMRINHTGEVCAQALYQGQALTARTEKIKAAMQEAATEEIDHLTWCFERLSQLDDRVSYLNPVWYLGALSMGIFAGILGDRWSLGFVAETEKQVAAHLDKHLSMLPIRDQKSRAIVHQMKEDELAHATLAIENGANELPKPVQKLMGFMSAVMTKTAYWL